MNCPKCETIRHDSGDGNARCSSCGVPYNEGYIAAVDDLWCLLTNPQRNRENIIEELKKKKEFRAKVIINYGQERW